MSKLEEALEEASGDNIAEAIYDKGKDKAKSSAKKAGKDAAKKGAKKALSGAKGAMKNVSQNGLGGAIKSGAKGAVSGAKTAGKSALAFAKGGPVTWIVGGLALLIIGSAIGGEGNTGRNSIGVSSDLTQEEEIVLILEADDGCPEPDYSDSSGESATGGGLDDPSSVYYQNAKKVFDQWVGAGLTGEAAAGIIGWVDSEGSFDMLGRAEGYYRSNDPKKASVAYGNEPIPSLSSYSVGGGGIYQFTPYTKYAPLGSPDWEDFEKMHEYLFNQVANKGDWNPKADYSDKNHSFRQFAESTIIEDTTLAWNAYERMNRGTWERNLPGIKDKKIAKAKQAYEEFNGSQYKFNEAVFESHFGSGSGDYVERDATGITDKCVGESIGGSPWGGDGGQPSITSGVFKYNMVPDELKKYALDLESLGLKYGNASDWKWNTSADHMQCVDLTSNLIQLIWQKDGQPIGNTKSMGNGGAVVGNYVGRFGGSSSKVPSAGAVFSTATGRAMCGGSLCGHTGVVSHVFDNGDFLVIEQNWGSYSGTAVGKNTYNYRYVQKSSISSSSFTFYDPSTSGHTFVEGLKSL